MNRKALILLVFIPLSCTAAGADSIRNTKHNLSSGGGGSIKSEETSHICIFCHTSHVVNAKAPMWNRESSIAIYSLYDSSTLHSSPGQPDGATKLCLSCHDGTIALGRTMHSPNAFSMRNTSGGTIPPRSRSNLDIDLSDDHPVSFDPASAVNVNTELRHPPPQDKVRYESSGKVGCTTCHDAHSNRYAFFLVKNNTNGQMCKTCHTKTGFNQVATHDTSTKIWNGSGENPWPHTEFQSVFENSCMNCHRSHGAQGKQRLLNRREEDVCLVCHNGNVGKDIQIVFNKMSGHHVGFNLGHDPAEDILTAAAHVDCADCHNPHRANGSSSAAPNISGRAAGVSGMTISGSIISSAQYGYEVCLKCHGQDQYIDPLAITRVFDTRNIRNAVLPGNPSFHAIAAQGRSAWIPSLIPPYTVSTRLTCVDCHNNDASTRVGGPGPDGPHGSVYENLLVKRYETGSTVAYSEDNYALCFMCHNPLTISDENLSGFSEHKEHLERDAPCSACHDPHGSPGYIALINFDTGVVFPSGNGQLQFEIRGNRGYCTLNCHGKDHNPLSYNRK